MPAAGFGIYFHWPFCRSKCPYCDFNSHVREQIDQARWREALLTELAHYAARAPRRTVSSIFFGGGTPSLMPPETVAALIEAVRRHWPVVEALEVSLEANPTSVEAARFEGFHAAGVNRVSLGVQALDDAALKFLGRGHSAAEALAAVEVARRQFRRISFDLIYARPGQSPAAWRRELDRALALAADHLSLYQLTIEENTGFYGAWKRGAIALPDSDLAAELYDVTQQQCDRAGLPAYEISNHAAVGAECRHNLVYWRYGEYLGIGPGAHGRFLEAGTRRATQQVRKPEAWLELVETGGNGTETDIAVERGEQIEELLMMGLRLKEGVRLDHFAAVAGASLVQTIPASRLQRLIDGGFLTLDHERLAATAAGRSLLNTLLAELLAA